MTAQQIEDVERYRRAETFCSNPRRPKRLTNRMLDFPKQKFIDQFIAEDRLYAYPVVEEDLQDENEFQLPEGRPVLRLVLAEQVCRAFELTHLKKAPDPEQVASDLLCSDCSYLLSDLEHLPVNEVTVELVLAHLESLGFDLPPRTSASVARRCVVVLLNAMHLRREP